MITALDSVINSKKQYITDTKLDPLYCAKKIKCLFNNAAEVNLVLQLVIKKLELSNPPLKSAITLQQDNISVFYSLNVHKLSVKV